MLNLLKTDEDFAAFRRSSAFQTKLLKIRVRSALNQNIPRFGFIVPKKLVPKVVDRNKLKRRIKSILNAYSKKMRGVDVVFYPQKALLKINYPTLKLEIEELFTKARLWK